MSLIYIKKLIFVICFQIRTHRVQKFPFYTRLSKLIKEEKHI